jgi:hypothetical protein
MPGATYLAPYQNLRLNEVVIPGAHDAGVYTANRSNVQTQKLDIAGQAAAGCRFFDVRVATHKSKVNGQTVYTHTTFHLDGSMVNKHKVKGVTGIGSHQTLRNIGGWGGDLVAMLTAAKTFVTTNGTEFLIFKFSKCYNWASIAETCIAVLGDTQYKNGGNLNLKQVKELKGKVITVFDEEARTALTPVIQAQVGGHGLMFIRALYDKDTGTSKPYDPHFWGIQYFGKFSSTDSVDKNTRKQGATMSSGAATDKDVLGMMYWTTTGLIGNIRARNKQMWSATNQQALRDTWTSGLESAIDSRFGKEKDEAIRLAMTSGGALGGKLKSFMPNIVMMDFVSQKKCDVIEDLNRVAAQSLLKLFVPAPRGVQTGYTDQTESRTRLSQMRG